MNELIEIERIIKHYDGLMIESGDRVLISSLQYTFGVNYLIAARTMDKLEELGIVEYRNKIGWFRK